MYASVPGIQITLVYVSTDLMAVLLECFLIEQSASMSTDDKGRSSSFTVITSAVDDPCITDTTSTDTTSTLKKASHVASLAAEYEPGRAKVFAALCWIFSAQRCANPFLPIYLVRFCHAITTGLKYDEQVTNTLW